ncbi:MAG: hypothetical protein ABJG42_24320 [Vibrio splendidus]
MSNVAELLKRTFAMTALLAHWAESKGYKVKAGKELPVVLEITDETGFKHEILLPPPSLLDDTSSAGFMATSRKTEAILNQFTDEVIRKDFDSEVSVSRVEIQGGEITSDDTENGLGEKFRDFLKDIKESGKTNLSGSERAYEHMDSTDRLSEPTTFDMTDVGDKWFDKDKNLCVSIGLDQGSVQSADRWNAVVLEAANSEVHPGQLLKPDNKKPIRILMTSPKKSRSTH